MKKYLLLLAGLLLAVPHGEAEAKVAKLGRGRAYSVATDSTVNTGTGKTELRKGECESDDECASDQKCMGYKCVSVCTQPTGRPGMSLARICAGKKCIADPNTPHRFMCVDGCYNVVCKSGYTTEVTADGCCCVASSCPSGQRLENGKCVANCTGVTCKSGYKAVSNSTGCCCEADTPTCSAAQVYHPILKKCVAAVCPAHCADMCSKGYCSSCEAGYTLGTDGMCKQNTLPSCSAGYYLKNGVCTACSSGTYSKGGTATSCSSCSTLYTSAGSNTCTSCTTTGTCLGSNTAVNCSVCTSGYTKNLKSCPSGQKLQQGPICVDSGFTCGKCVSSSSSGSSSSCPRSPTGSKSAGSSCSTGSECSSGWCIPGTTVNPSYTGSGSLCGACH